MKIVYCVTLKKNLIILVSKSNVYIKILENESEKDKMIKKRQFASFCDKYSKKIAPFNYKNRHAMLFI